MQAYGMFKQFLSLIGLKEDYRIEAEGNHPIGRQEIEQRAKPEAQRRGGEQGLGGKNDVEVGQMQVMCRIAVMRCPLILRPRVGLGRSVDHGILSVESVP
jgi:hypothetical protein